MPSTSVVFAARRPQRTGVNSRERSGKKRRKVSPLERGDGSEADIGGDTGTEVSGGGAGGCSPAPFHQAPCGKLYKSDALHEMPQCVQHQNLLNSLSSLPL